MMNQVISRQKGYLPPVTREILLVPRELIAGSWNDAELNGNFVDLYDDEL